MPDDPLRYAREHEDLHPAFGSDRFGAIAERVARFFGTPQYLLGQSVLVAAWVALNAVAFGLNWDPYPFILLNLVFSTQAAYAAPLILLAQTRQADRDKAHEETAARHRDAIAADSQALLQQNTDLTEQVKELTQQVAELTKGIARVVGA
jgi:uncharacterized membrane protein